jgi:O-antigen ligase
VLHGITAADVFLAGVFGLLALQSALGHPPVAQERPLLMAFAIWCAFGVVSWAVVSAGGFYRGYEIVHSGLLLKQRLFEHAIVFAGFFFGAQYNGEARFVMKALLAAVFLAAFLHVLDALGIVGLGLTVLWMGRVTGLMGEVNQTGVFAAAFIPVFIGMAFRARQLERMFWIAGAGVLTVHLLLTASRGGVAGLVLAGMLGVALFFRYVRPGRVLAFTAAALVVFAIIFASIGVENRSLLIARFIGESTARGAANLSSGRTEIWGQVLGFMSDSPWSFVTGMGWDTYHLFGAVANAHNTFLGLWFNLGIIGLGCLLFILGRTIWLARDACSTANPADRALLIGAALGLMGASIASFFVDIYAPWQFLWMLTGLTARLAVNVRAERPAVVPLSVARPAHAGAAAEVVADPWGWRARPSLRR